MSISQPKISVLLSEKLMYNMENIGETLSKRDNITINIAQESCECACITDVQNSYNTPVQQSLQLRV